MCFTKKQSGLASVRTCTTAAAAPPSAKAERAQSVLWRAPDEAADQAAQQVQLQQACRVVVLEPAQGERTAGPGCRRRGCARPPGCLGWPWRTSRAFKEPEPRPSPLLQLRSSEGEELRVHTAVGAGRLLSPAALALHAATSLRAGALVPWCPGAGAAMADPGRFRDRNLQFRKVPNLVSSA